MASSPALVQGLALSRRSTRPAYPPTAASVSSTSGPLRCAAPSFGRRAPRHRSDAFHLVHWRPPVHQRTAFRARPGQWQDLRAAWPPLRPVGALTWAVSANLLSTPEVHKVGTRDAGWSSSVARCAHNPEVAGSNPAPATRSEAPSNRGRGLLHVICERICERAAVHAASPPLSPDAVPPIRREISKDASAPPMISSARVLATWRSASRSVWTYCFMVKATSACPMRLLRAFQSIFAFNRGGVAVTDVVEVDLGEPGRRGQLLEPAGDGVRVRGSAVLPAEQQPVILVVRAQVFPFPVQRLDVSHQRGQGERVQRN